MDRLLPWQKALVDQVEKALLEVEAGGNSRGILFSGASGTGKTAALDLISKSRPPSVEGFQRRVPCCRISNQARSDTISVAQSILIQLGKPESATSRLKPRVLEGQVHAAIRACGVRVLILVS